MNNVNPLFSAHIELKRPGMSGAPDSPGRFIQIRQLNPHPGQPTPMKLISEARGWWAGGTAPDQP